jgi:hypothetical protein
MALATLKRQAARLAADVQAVLTARSRREHPALTRLRTDPARIMADAGLQPDPWQSECLRAPPQYQLLLCSRQAGKSQTAAGLALRTALLQPGSLVLLLSPTLRQSGELFRDKVKRLYNALGRPVATVQESALTMELANGSRVVSLPGEEGSIRGYSGVALLVVDEAARVDDALYCTIRPMLAISRGQLVALSTPFGRRGWFYDAWQSAEPWRRVKITAAQCPRITLEFLAEERRSIGERWFNQEYGCEFLSAIGAVFSGTDIDAAFVATVKPMEFPP